MASKITMPKLSDTMEQGLIVKLLKSEGDRVEPGDVLAEVETDKATMELEVFEEGVIRKIFVAEGDGIPIGGPVAVLGEDEDEDVESLIEEMLAEAEGGSGGEGDSGKAEGDSGEDGGDSAEQEGAASSPREEPADEPERSRDGGSASVAAPRPGGGGPSLEVVSGSGGRVFASPVARKLAADKGIALELVKGSGPSGRIVKADVLAAAAAGTGARPAPGPAGLPSAGPEVTEVPPSTMREIIARRMVESKFQAPHFYVTMDCDMRQAVRFREQLKAQDRKFSFNDLVLKAVAQALVRVPAMNGTYEDGRVLQYRDAHVGFAVAFEGGLITPVVRSANLKSLGAIAAETRELIGRAKEKKLKPEEYTGGTFTISNMGMFGVEEFTAIINRPQIAIVAVGGIRDEPVVDGGAVVPGKRMKMTVSTDHRAADGADAARFLGEVRAMLEDPALLVW